MNCTKVRTALSAISDRRLRDPEPSAVAEHLAGCPDCRQFACDLRSVSVALKELKPKQPPTELTYQLRVLVSHERARVEQGAEWWPSFRFRLQQILRPLAVPAAGGIFSSLLFFAVLAPNFTVHASTGWDVPVVGCTAVSMVSPSPFGFNGRDITVEVTIDENNKVSDYSVQGAKLSNQEMHDVANFILFSTFKAATAFGQPVSSKMLLNLTHTDNSVRS